jgi:hypothetical protein
MTEQRKAMLVDGLVAGAVGYAAVAVFFMVLNVMVGRPALYTAALLGEMVFGGVADPSVVTMDPTMVIAFNGVQLVALLLFGFFAAWLVYETELHPVLWYLAFALFVVATVAGFAVVLVMTVLIGAVVSPWLVVSASILGAAVIAAYFAIRHRSLVGAIRHGLGEPEQASTE